MFHARVKQDLLSAPKEEGIFNHLATQISVAKRVSGFDNYSRFDYK